MRASMFLLAHSAICLHRPLLQSHAAARATVFARESPEFGKFGAASSPQHTHARTHMQCPLPERTAVPHNELSPGCAPLGVLCAGLSEDALEDLADAVESVFESPDEVGSEPKASSWRRHSLLPQG